MTYILFGGFTIIGFAMYMIAVLIYGFFAAAIAQKVLVSALRFHAEWNGTLIASTLTVILCMASQQAIQGVFKGTQGFYQVISATAIIGIVVGTTACRLIIKSESGRSLSILRAAALSAAMFLPPVLVMAALRVVLSDV